MNRVKESYQELPIELMVELISQFIQEVLRLYLMILRYYTRSQGANPK